METIRAGLNELQENEIQREKHENDVTGSLVKLDDKLQKYHQILVDQQVVNQEFQMQVSESSKEMAIKLNGQLNQQQRIVEQISEQTNSQEVIISRLDHQEGLTEKILRQLDHLRGVFYERTNFLTEKIESSYTMTASHLAKLLTNPEQPMTHFWMNPKSEQKQKKVD